MRLQVAVLLFFERRVYPERDSTAEDAIIARLEQAIFRTGSVDARTSVLIALADQSGILKCVLDRAKLKANATRWYITTYSTKGAIVQKSIINCVMEKAYRLEIKFLLQVAIMRSVFQIQIVATI